MADLKSITQAIRATLTSSQAGLISLDQTNDVFISSSQCYSNKFLVSSDYHNIVGTVTSSNSSYVFNALSIIFQRSLIRNTPLFSTYKIPYGITVPPSGYINDVYGNPISFYLNGTTGSYAVLTGGITGSSSSYLQQFRTCLTGVKTNLFDPSTASITSYIHGDIANTYNDTINDTRLGLGTVGIIYTPKIKFGEAIRPSSFTAAISNNWSLVDSSSSNDSFGIINLVPTNSLSTNWKSCSVSAGFIFYDLGIALIHGPTLTAVNLVSSITSINFQSTYNMYQYNFFCTAGADQLNYSTNDNIFYNNSMTGDPDDNPSLTSYTNGYQWGTYSLTGNYRSQFYLKDFWKRSPYITSIGLYDDNNNLLAIAKLATPLRKSFNTPTTIRIILDAQ